MPQNVRENVHTKAGHLINKAMKSLLLVIASTLLFACQSSQSASPVFDSSINLSNQDDVIVLLHGMYRDKRAMRPVEQYLSELGYTTVNISYPSTEYDIDTLARDYLHPNIEELRLQKGQKLHFVTHSMGGILVRAYLKEREIDALGRVVMIAPPNNGTPLADLFNDSSWIKQKHNPAKLQIGVLENSWVQQLGPVDFEVGVIAGNYNKNWVTDFLLPGDDDGVVSVESTKIDNMKDFVTVPEKHYRLRANPLVLQQTAHFLKYGEFLKSDKTIRLSQHRIEPDAN